MITAKQMGFPAYRRRELACDFSAINLFIFLGVENKFTEANRNKTHVEN
jgi:hypothetical protein